MSWMNVVAADQTTVTLTDGGFLESAVVATDGDYILAGTGTSGSNTVANGLLTYVEGDSSKVVFAYSIDTLPTNSGTPSGGPVALVNSSNTVYLVTCGETVVQLGVLSWMPVAVAFTVAAAGGNPGV